MPVDPIVGGTIAQIGTNILNQKQQNYNNKFEFSQNMMMYNMQRQDALNDWRMQNEYNSPIAQVERMKAAGLNPHTANGSSIVSTASAQQARGSQAQAAPRAYQVNSGTQGMSTMLALEQIKNMRAQTEKTQQEAKSAAIDTQQKQLIYDTDSETMRSTKFAGIWTAEAQENYIKAGIDEKKQIIEATKVRMQKDLQDIELAKIENVYRGELLRGKANLQYSQAKQVAAQTDKIRSEIKSIDTNRSQSIQMFPYKVKEIEQQLRLLKNTNETKDYENFYLPEHLRERNTQDTIRTRKEDYELKLREVVSPELRELLNKAPYLINMVSKFRK